MRKVLILTVTAGNGHNACARAVKNALESSGDTEVKVVDLLKTFSTKMNVWIADGGYNLAMRRLPRIFTAFYDHYNRAKPENRYSCAGQGVPLSTVDGLLKEIITYQPDVIYCCHFYGAIALTDLKLAYDLPCKVIASVTNFCNTPFWEAAVGVDYLTLLNEDFIEEYVYEGFEKQKLLPIGRPVDMRTLSVDRAQAREKLGIGEDDFTVFVMYGGGNWGGSFALFKSVAKALNGQRANIIMINGKDKKSYSKIAKMKFTDGLNVINVGFTNEVPLYLSAADVAIGKCGGGFTNETINAGVPMLITEKLAVNEIYNLDYLRKKGVALSFKNQKDLTDKLKYLKENPDKREQMKGRMPSLKRNAVIKLTEIIKAQPSADYSALTAENIDFKNVRKIVKKAVKNADKLSKHK